MFRVHGHSINLERSTNVWLTKERSDINKWKTKGKRWKEREKGSGRRKVSEWLALPLVLCTYCAIPISGADVFINELVIIKTKNECQSHLCLRQIQVGNQISLETKPPTCKNCVTVFTLTHPLQLTEISWPLLTFLLLASHSCATLSRPLM